jgi:hypothetical protein
MTFLFEIYSLVSRKYVSSSYILKFKFFNPLNNLEGLEPQLKESECGENKILLITLPISITTQRTSFIAQAKIT